MKRQDFETLVNSYGADARRWPEQLRKEAQLCMDQHPDLVRDAKTLDEMLDGYTVTDMDPAFLNGIATKVETLNHHQNIIVLLRPRAWFRNTAILMATVAGFFFGSVTWQQNSASSRQQEYTNAINLDQVILGPKTFNEVML